VRPDLSLYFRVPIDVSVDRLMARRIKLKFYEAGLDMGWSSNPVESFRLFQGKVLDEYDQLVKEFGLETVDASGSITQQQRLVRTLVAPHVQPTLVDVRRGRSSMTSSSDGPIGARRGRQRRAAVRHVLRP
jgi:dTMP kinase